MPLNKVSMLKIVLCFFPINQKRIIQYSQPNSQQIYSASQTNIRNRFNLILFIRFRHIVLSMNQNNNKMNKIVGKFHSLTLTLTKSYTPVSNYQVQKKTNPVLAVSIGKPQQPLCDLHFRLFENTVPKTTQNFKRLLLGTANYQGKPLSLIGNHFHHVVSRAYATLGYLEQGNCSIYGPTFRDQSFELPHDRPGLLSCISEQNTNNSRFLITFAPCPFLDLRNVVFGQITAQTIDHLKTLEKIGSKLTDYQILSASMLEIEHKH